MGGPAGGGTVCGSGEIDAGLKVSFPVIKWSHLHVAWRAEDSGDAVGDQIVAGGELDVGQIGLGDTAGGICDGREQDELSAVCKQFGGTIEGRENIIGDAAGGSCGPGYTGGSLWAGGSCGPGYTGGSLWAGRSGGGDVKRKSPYFI